MAATEMKHCKKALLKYVLKNKNMDKKKITKLERINHQLSLIDNTNEMIKSCKAMDSKLEVRQYEHIKKKLILNLIEMLEEDYQISLLSLKAA